MYKIIDGKGKCYTQFNYKYEDEFEEMVIENADAIFGKDGIYFNFKKLIGTRKKGATIPDGYYLDLTFHTDPRLYLVEVELNTHDVFKHIGEQLLRFGIATETDKYKVRAHLLSALKRDADKQAKLNEYYEHSTFNNNNELLDRVIIENKPASIIVIDETSEELYNVLAQLTMSVEVIEVQSYLSGSKLLHRITPFKDEILSDVPKNEDADELDTLVVPAREEGFNDEFINNYRWYAVRISERMIDKIRYIAAYQVAPVSAITYIAEVERIDRYQNTDKYILYFKRNTVQKINKIILGENSPLRSPRYTAYKSIKQANNIGDLWG